MLVAMLVTMLAAAVPAALAETAGAERSAPEQPLPAPLEVGAFELVADDGTAFTEQDLRGRWTLLFFGYTHCPDICPLTLAELGVLDRSRRDGPLAAHDFRYVFVTLDPARDTVEHMASYVGFFGDDFIGVSATEPLYDELDRLLTALDVAVIIYPPDAAGDYPIDHSGDVHVIAPDGRRIARLAVPHQASDMLARLEQLVASYDERRD